ncbi:hypothetical protein ACFW04_006372 [Cataglyphis niger]
MFRFINKNLAVGNAEIADMSCDIGVGVVGQLMPRTSFDVYRESHLLALGGSIDMRSSLKHEMWGKRDSHLKMCVDFLGVSLSFHSFSCILHANYFFRYIPRDCYSIIGHVYIFGATRSKRQGRFSAPRTTSATRYMTGT